MSCTELYSFDKTGNAHHFGDVRNAWRGAMEVWRIMEERHLPSFVPEYVKFFYWYHPGISQEEVEAHLGYKPTRCMPSFGDGENPMHEIWELANNEDVPEFERIVLCTTFDDILVRREQIPMVIDAFRRFGGETSLPEQADVLEKMLADPDIIAVGWNQTSVNGDSWDVMGGYDEEKEEHIPYNCLSGDRHVWIFDPEEDEEV